MKDFLEQLADGKVREPPPDFRRRLHQRLNRTLRGSARHRLLSRCHRLERGAFLPRHARLAASDHYGPIPRPRPPLSMLQKMPMLPPSRFFPPAQSADSEGVVGFGGNLTSDWLLDAYEHGIFPWPTGDPSLPVPWCSPDPRAIFELDRFHVPRRLVQTCRSGKFRVTFDTDFSGVIRGCATSGRAAAIPGSRRR